MKIALGRGRNGFVIQQEMRDSGAGRAGSISLQIKSLGKGWHDKDEIILHAVFQLLVDFMEQEHPEKTVDWKSDAVSYKAWKELNYLYKWWKTTRPKWRSPINEKSTKCPPIKFKKIPGSELTQMIMPDRRKYPGYYRMMNRHFRLEKKWHEEDQRNLHRLIDLRNHLWT